MPRVRMGRYVFATREQLGTEAAQWFSADCVIERYRA